MADKITTTNQLKLLAGFADEDDRTITFDEPKSGLTWSDIESLASKAQNVLIGDKYSAAFTRFKSAKYVESTVVEVDTNGNS